MLLAGRLRQRYDYFNHAKAILIEAQLGQVGVNLVKQEVMVFLVETAALEHLADHVRTLLIYRQLVDGPLKCLPDKALLLVHGNIVKDGLDCVRPLLVAADADEIVFDQVQDLEPLLN